MLLSLARHIPKANTQLHSGVWNRSIKGIQIRNKILGIIGLGRVGTEVAEMAKALHMNVIAYDPMVSENRAERLGIQMVELEDLLARRGHLNLRQHGTHLVADGVTSMAELKKVCGPARTDSATSD